MSFEMDIYDYLRGTEQCVALNGVTSMFLQVYLSGQYIRTIPVSSMIWLICNCLRAPNWLHMWMIYYCANQWKVKEQDTPVPTTLLG